MKHLHRLIVTSRAYRTASTPNAANLARDADNRWLWRMPPRRMEAELVRDCVLHAAGKMDAQLGGPDLPESRMDFLKVFDGADPTEAYQRHASIVPHQALALFNSDLTAAQSRQLAAKLSKAHTGDGNFIRAAYEQILTRAPTAEELKLCGDFLHEQKSNARERLVHALFNHHEFVTIR